MGSPPDEPVRGRNTEDQHEVTLSQSFVMGQHEVTQNQWREAGFVSHAGSANSPNAKDCLAPTCPASTMSWYEAVQFTNALSDREGLPHCVELEDCTQDGGARGSEVRCASYRQTTPSYYECRGYRLPTQPEFEYAIRAGTKTAFYTGPFEPSGTECFDVPHVSEAAWYCANSGESTHPVGQKKPNSWGLHDMMGNAGEWVASNPNEVATGYAPQRNPFALLSLKHTFGAAGWFLSSPPWVLRSAMVAMTYTTSINNAVGRAIGLRVVRSVSDEEAARW